MRDLVMTWLPLGKADSSLSLSLSLSSIDWTTKAMGDLLFAQFVALTTLSTSICIITLDILPSLVVITGSLRAQSVRPSERSLALRCPGAGRWGNRGERRSLFRLIPPSPSPSPSPYYGISHPPLFLGQKEREAFCKPGCQLCCCCCCLKQNR